MDINDEPTLLEQLDSSIPKPLAKFDAFPKIPSTYKTRSESRGFMTIFVAFVAILLVLNDIGEYVWGWPDYEFSVDRSRNSWLDINVDLVVNMPCDYLSVDLRDAVGDRLYLSRELQRDGTYFDVRQATTLQAHSKALSATQAVAQSRKSRGFFSNLFRKTASAFRPRYKHMSHTGACRISGTVTVKKVTANLHITTLGHGYASMQHVDHKLMNLSHVITEFSFGPYFPDITQPLDYSYEATPHPFVTYQYYLRVVPTTYIAPRTAPLRTNQYSVTHYTKILENHQGTPGIFFRFDLDPMSLTIHQRTTTFLQLMIRCVGVIGGVFVCTGYAIRITSRAVQVVTGNDSSEGEIAAAATGAKVSLRDKWGGGSLRSRPGKVVRQGNSWVVEGTGSPYAGSPLTGGFGPGVSPPYLNSTAAPGGLGLSPSAFGPVSQPGSPGPRTASFPAAPTYGSPYLPPPPPSAPPSYNVFPPSPGPGSGFPQSQGPSPSRSPVPSHNTLSPPGTPGLPRNTTLGPPPPRSPRSSSVPRKTE